MHKKKLLKLTGWNIQFIHRMVHITPLQGNYLGRY